MSLCGAKSYDFSCVCDGSLANNAMPAPMPSIGCHPTCGESSLVHCRIISSSYILLQSVLYVAQNEFRTGMFFHLQQPAVGYSSSLSNLTHVYSTYPGRMPQEVGCKYDLSLSFVRMMRTIT